MSAVARVLVLGGYGHFGARICRALNRGADCELIVAGRNADKAAALARDLGERHRGMALDDTDSDLAGQIAIAGASIAIHTCGPYQGQGYQVAEACIAAGAHHIGLTDGREFVAGIAALDERACARGVMLTSGASTLPALSFAVIDEHRL